MLLDDLRALAGRKGFTLSARGGLTYALIDLQLGLPAVNLIRESLVFSMDEAITYLLASHDRLIDPKKSGSP
jgi:hypothetical protein